MAEWPGMKTPDFASVVFLVSCVVVGCGGANGGEQLCERVNECAVKSGAAFSESACKDDMKQSLEEAETSGCGDEYADYMDCVGSLELECSDDLEARIVSECGAKVKKAAACVGAGSSLGKDACEVAMERIYRKIEACGGSVPPSQRTSSESDVECTEEAAAQARESASDFEALPCDTIVEAFPPQ